ncbi:MAG: metallophosphoesterase family protein [Chloroflexota bacterium]|jgi:predicted phosphodiesterase
MRIAAIYDIHGNAPALEAVLQDIAHDHVSLIVVGGDVLAGPMPRESFVLLLDCKTPMLFIRGNADREVIAVMRGEDIGEMPKSVREVVIWVAQQLDPWHQELLSGWPETLSLSVSGLGEVLFCHATPQSDTVIFTRLTPETRLRPIFNEVSESLVVCGHTHMQFERMIGDVRVVNAGSVGMPYGETGAHWLLLDAGVEFKNTAYDLEAAAERIRAANYPQAEVFASDNVLSTPSEAEALEIFEPMTLGGNVA